MEWKCIYFRGKLRPFADFRAFLLVAIITLGAVEADMGANKAKPQPDDIFEVVALAKSQVEEAWNVSTSMAEQSDDSAAAGVSEFWRKLKLVLQSIHYEVKNYDRRIISNRPSSLMNRALDLQDLSTLMALSDNADTKNPYIKWRVKWIELSSLATHIHRLYNKRLRDIMNDEPYIKTVATSIHKYMGYPWYSKLSGNHDDTFRSLMRHYPDYIENRIKSVKEGDLFYGLRQLLDLNPTAKASSSMEAGDCKGTQTIGKIIPASLEGPIYVLIYLCLVDIKYFILMNFYYIYLYVYESIGFDDFERDKLEAEMDERIGEKVKMYKDAFKDYDKITKNMPMAVQPGYFRCDPPQPVPDNPIRGHVRKQTYIKITNFLKVFIAPEKSFRASKSCAGSCDMIDGTRAPCDPTDLACVAMFEDECAKNPEACEDFKPPCPIDQTVCIDSGLQATYCPSKRRDRILEWVEMNDKMLGEPENCTEEVVKLKGDWEMENEPVADTPAQCEICMCHCFAPVGSDLSSVRSFSLKPALSLTKENKIVVGIKFEQVKDQIHLMVAEATALPGGKVDSGSVLWRKPKPANDSDDASPPQIVKVTRNKRIFHLDDIVAPPGHVVTGVRFVQSSHSEVYQHEFISIQIQVYEIDESTGKLNMKSKQWMGNNNSTISREPYVYVDPDDPIKGDGPALPDSSSNQFITFRGTSVTKDLAQSTIPYFDAQRVILDADNSGWLKGIGTYHKARPRFGGFLGFKIIKYFDEPLIT